MEGLKKLKQMWDENPLAVLAVVGASLAGVGKLIDSMGGVQSRRAYAKQVNRKNKS